MLLVKYVHNLFVVPHEKKDHSVNNIVFIMQTVDEWILF